MRLDYFDVTRRVKKKYAQIMEPVCREKALTANALDVLLFFYNNPEFDRAADAVQHRGMVKSHVSVSVAELEEKGLLVRVPEPEDRRTVHLKLTESGRQIAEAGRLVQQTFFARLFSGLSREELSFWQEIIDKVCRNVDEICQI